MKKTIDDYIRSGRIPLDRFFSSEPNATYQIVGASLLEKGQLVLARVCTNFQKGNVPNASEYYDRKGKFLELADKKRNGCWYISATVTSCNRFDYEVNADSIPANIRRRARRFKKRAERYMELANKPEEPNFTFKGPGRDYFHFDDDGLPAMD